MTDTRVLSNQKVTVWIGPETGIANWNAPLLSEVTAFLNVSGAVNWDSFDFNITASDQADDRTLTDAAGAQSRSFNNFGGNIEFVNPLPADTTSIFRQTYTLLKGDRTKLAVVIRVGVLNSVAIAAGDVVNAYHVLADAQSTVRGDVSYAYKVDFLPQNDLGVNCIIPLASPGVTTLTPSAPTALAIGSVKYVKATYQGVNTTIGTTWVSSAPLICQVTPHGALIGLTAGTANITGIYAGGVISAALVITVS